MWNMYILTQFCLGKTGLHALYRKLSAGRLQNLDYGQSVNLTLVQISLSIVLLDILWQFVPQHHYIPPQDSRVCHVGFKKARLYAKDFHVKRHQTQPEQDAKCPFRHCECYYKDVKQVLEKMYYLRPSVNDSTPYLETQ